MRRRRARMGSKVVEKTLFLIGIVCGTFSCTTSETEDEFVHNAITFNSTIGDPTTKAASTYGIIDLTALRASTDGFAVSTTGLGASTEMNNLVVKYASSLWSYSGDYFWPISPSQNVSFTAYAPAGATGVALTSSGLTATKFIPAASAANQIDLIYAAPANYNRGSSGSTGVPLAFKHVLTQVVFSATTLLPTLLNPTIVSMTLTVPHNSGSFNGTSWTSSSAPQTYTIFTNRVLGLTPIVSTPLLLIPQTLVSGTNVVISTSLSGILQGTQTVDLSTTSKNTWSIGKKITYNVTLSSVTRSNIQDKPLIEITGETKEGFD